MSLEIVQEYHGRTKHQFHRYAAGPGGLDWATQPNPFRTYSGARQIALPRDQKRSEVLYDDVLAHEAETREIGLQSISDFFFRSLALSAWKQAGSSRWALRVNPSSGNLHPTEGYLISGPIAGINDHAFVAHYLPREHALEIRAEFPAELWERLVGQSRALLFGLTSVHWREAWKYGERAFRYCQHDVGHALAAASLSSASLGWNARLADEPSTDELAALLGTGSSRSLKSGEAEPEHPDTLVWITSESTEKRLKIEPSWIAEFAAQARWFGQANALSPDHVEWPVIDEVAHETRKPRTEPAVAIDSVAASDPVIAAVPVLPPAFSRKSEIEFGRLVHQRRSAVDFDGVTSMEREVFYRILERVMPVSGTAPWSLFESSTLARPRAHLLLFVHRVLGLEPGIYFLARDPERVSEFRSKFKNEPDFAWKKPDSCPESLPLYQLVPCDCRDAARIVSCQQEIASDSCFSLGMIAEFDAPLREVGPWLYPRLFWETGMIGQVLYLEAEAFGLRGTGIGCFFDNPVNRILGIEDLSYQSLYHFTVGGPVEDRRLLTLPGYSD